MLKSCTQMIPPIQQVSRNKHMKIVSGHNKLQVHHHKLGFSKTSSCECGCPIQDEKHIMLHCPVYLSSWENMINSIERTFNQEAVPCCKRRIDLSSVLLPNLLYGQKVSNNITRQSTNFWDLYTPICLILCCMVTKPVTNYFTVKDYNVIACQSAMCE